MGIGEWRIWTRQGYVLQEIRVRGVRYAQENRRGLLKQCGRVGGGGDKGAQIQQGGGD